MDIQTTQNAELSLKMAIERIQYETRTNFFMTIESNFEILHPTVSSQNPITQTKIKITKSKKTTGRRK